MAAPGSFPILRFLRRAAWALVFILAAAFGFLALIPSLFGKDVGAGFASVDASLCVLASDGAAEIVVGGDSRAQAQVDPLLLEELTGKRAVNVAEGITFGGDLPTLVNALRGYPQVLAKRPILILSVSVTGFNDLAFADLPAASVFNWSLRDHARAALRRPGKYFPFLFGWYGPYLKRHILHEIRGTRFRCADGARLPPAVLASRGFRPLPPRPDSLRLRVGREPRSPSDFLLEGGRRRAFIQALDWLAASPARAILLYNAPIVPEWQSDPAHALDMEMEHRFADAVAALTAPRPKVRFVDFVRNPLPDLDRTRFADNYHLDAAGAALFTRHLAARLADSGWIAPRQTGPFPAPAAAAFPGPSSAPAAAP